MPQTPHARRSRPTSPPPGRPRRAVPAAILGAGVVTAALILISAAHDSVPPPSPQAPLGVPSGQYGAVVRTPDDPANQQPWTPDGR